MKKTLNLILSLTLLSSCSFEETSGLTIISPTGAPAICFYNYSENDNFSTTSNAELLQQYFMNGSYDVIAAPTNVGFRCINQGASYKIAATISFGNLYLVSTGLDDNDKIDIDDSFVCFQKSAVPGILFKFIFGNEIFDKTTFVKDVSMAATAYQNKFAITEEGKKVGADYVVLAEPKLSSIKNYIKDNKVYSFSDLYRERTNGYNIFQASIFVKSSLEKEDCINFLSNLENDINNGIKNPTLVQEALEKSIDDATIYGVTGKLAAVSLSNNNGLGIGYANAIEHKKDIDKFLACFGIGEANEETYFK